MPRAGLVASSSLFSNVSIVLYYVELCVQMWAGVIPCV